MGVCGAVCGCKGDAGFSGPVLGVNSGVVGFNVAMLLRAVREVFRTNRPCAGLGCSAALPAPAAAGGFALHEALRGRVSGVSEPHVVQFPPFGGSPSVVLVGAVPKVQTTSAKTGDNGLLRARWSTFWAQWCLSWCACSQVNSLFGLPTR